MARQLKYYKEIESHGHLWRVEILQETEDTLMPMEIGPVLQGLRLVVQGDQADVDTPIVKTSLEMTFIDAPDLDDDRKCGYWEEFYTSSATEYQVRLYKDGQIEWSGYVTPDSFSEDLRYRGSVSIIARDNLGALQDFEYNYTPEANGLVRLHEILQNALKEISFPMQISASYRGTRYTPVAEITTEVRDVEDICFNSNSFKGKTCLEALENVLSATGTTLRYVGSNTFMWASLRDIPLYDKDYWFDVPILEAAFLSYGKRELSPAVKKIVDEVTFDIQENIAEVDMPNEAYGEEMQCQFVDEDTTGNGAIYNIPVYSVVNGSWEPRTVDKTLYFNPFAYSYKEGYSSNKNGDLKDPSLVYLVANTSPADREIRSAEWKCEIGPGRYRFSMKIGQPIALYDNNTKIGVPDERMSIVWCWFYLRYTSKDGTIVQEYRIDSGKWENVQYDQHNRLRIASAEGYDLVPPILEIDSVGVLQLIIEYVSVVKINDLGISKGAYIPFKELKLTDANLENTSIPGKRKITTQYNLKNNILIQRNPEYGFNSADVASPKIIRNGMFITLNDWYESSYNWSFMYNDVPQPLPVLIHQQLLAYYSKPNNVLSGELATPNPLFNALYVWNGKKHILTSGTLNILTGRMESAVLREFTRYDRMWETWVENEDIDMDYQAGRLAFVVHTNKDLDQGAWQDFPSWISPVGHSKEEGDIYLFDCDIMENASGQERSAIFRIDTAYVRVTQSAAGDYNIDYGTDYS